MDDLVPFKTGRATGRPSLLDDPENINLFAQALVDGGTTKKLSKLFSISERSVRTYKNDSRVKAVAARLIEDRIFRVTRKIDAEIEARLQDAEELSTDTLIKLRKEFLGGTLRLKAQGDKTDADTINAAMDELEDNPEFASELSELLNRQPSKK